MPCRYTWHLTRPPTRCLQFLPPLILQLLIWEWFWLKALWLRNGRSIDRFKWNEMTLTLLKWYFSNFATSKLCKFETKKGFKELGGGVAQWTISWWFCFKVNYHQRQLGSIVTSKKLPNVYKSCPKMALLKNDRFRHLYKNCLRMWEIWAN